MIKHICAGAQVSSSGLRAEGFGSRPEDEVAKEARGARIAALHIRNERRGRSYLGF